jgi:hypothetical protein
MSPQIPRPADDDAQRALEQQALRNVRGLVDKIDSLEATDRRAQARLLGAVVAAVAIAIALTVWYLERHDTDSRSVEISAPAARIAPK